MCNTVKCVKSCNYSFSNATNHAYQFGQGMGRDETSTCRNTGSVGELFILLNKQSKVMTVSAKQR
jgi:hypothetical protein